MSLRQAQIRQDMDRLIKHVMFVKKMIHICIKRRSYKKDILSLNTILGGIRHTKKRISQKKRKRITMSLAQTEKQYCSTTSKGNGNIEVLTQEKSVRMMKRGFFRGKPF